MYESYKHEISFLSILVFMSSGNIFMLSSVEHEKKIVTSLQDLIFHVAISYFFFIPKRGRHLFFRAKQF